MHILLIGATGFIGSAILTGSVSGRTSGARALPTQESGCCSQFAAIGAREVRIC